MGERRARGGYCCYVLGVLIVLCSSLPWVFWCVFEYTERSKVVAAKPPCHPVDRLCGNMIPLLFLFHTVVYIHVHIIPGTYYMAWYHK